MASFSDLRSGFERFQPESIAANKPFVDRILEPARRKGAMAAQLSLTRLLGQKPFIVPIPGTVRAVRQVVLDEPSASRRVAFGPRSAKTSLTARRASLRAHAQATVGMRTTVIPRYRRHYFSRQETLTSTTWSRDGWPLATTSGLDGRFWELDRFGCLLLPCVDRRARINSAVPLSIAPRMRTSTPLRLDTRKFSLSPNTIKQKVNLRTPETTQRFILDGNGQE